MVRMCTTDVRLDGKTAIITGANSGIGYETALEFARRGGRVILACRNQERADVAKDKIVKETGNENVVVKLIDLESLDSVRQFAKDIIDTEERLDILVNNAGVLSTGKRTTADGLQGEMQANYFGPFLLTILLLDLLKKSGPSRIVNVASLMARMAKLDLNNLNDYPGSLRMYANTKLCNILFTVELAKRLLGTTTTTYSVHPGTVRTEIGGNSWVARFLKKFYMTPVKGAQTSIYCSLQPGLEPLTGKHFDDSKPVGYAKAEDPELARKLWEITEETLGLKNDQNE